MGQRKLDDTMKHKNMNEKEEKKNNHGKKKKNYNYDENTDSAKGWLKVIYLMRLEKKENSLYFTLINGLYCLIKMASMILRSVTSLFL